jgi:hypothetical protein
MYTALISVLNDRIIVDVEGPSGLPATREVVGKGDAVDILELRGHLCETAFKPSVMVAKQMEEPRMWCRFDDLPETFLANVQLFFDRRKLIPANRRVARYGTTIKYVPVRNHERRL